MAFTLEELLPEDQQPRTVQMHDLVSYAIDLMHLHDYSQLPVVDANGKKTLGKIVAFAGILQAVQSFNADVGTLLVKDVAQGVRTYLPDADLLETLDDIQRHNFALIVEEDETLIGIVTTADTTLFFRKYAQDLMLIEGIETRMKEAITALYGGDETALAGAIAAATDYVADIRRKLRPAIGGYLEKCGITQPPAGTDTEGLAEAEKRLALPKPGKEFDKLSFEEISQVLLKAPSAPKLSRASDSSHLRTMLAKVRDARNKLAHFRGEVTADERRHILLAAEWLEENLPVPVAPEPVQRLPGTEEITRPGQLTVTGPEEEPLTGSYAPLAKYLKGVEAGVTSLEKTFQEMEQVLGKALPQSAYDYRVWWANSRSPQSAAWLGQGWRTASVSMRDRRLTFVRTNERAKQSIEFFSSLADLLDGESGLPLRSIPANGSNWQALVLFNWKGRTQGAGLFATFTSRRQLRIELYLDCGNKAENKSKFDELLLRRIEIERIVGEPLKWERREESQSCRIAIYKGAEIQVDYSNAELLQWACEKTVAFYKAFAPAFPANQ